MVHFRRLLRLLRRRGHSKDDAEDLIQDAFLSLHSYSQRAEVHSTEAFLVRAVINRSINFQRDEHRELYADTCIEELEIPSQNCGPDEILAAGERLDRIVRALDAVGPRTRDVFLMHRLLGFSQPEIARRMGVTVSAVERRIARALCAVTEELYRDQHE